MTDPLDALRAPVEPVDPDPVFAERLRERLRRAVLNPLGGSMTETVQQAESTDGGWPPTLTPYIVVSDARRAMDWYVEVFGATRRGEPHVNSDGSVGHAEVGVGDAVLMFAEASDLYPEVPVAPPAEPPSTHSHTLHLQVEDVDGTTRRAAARGAQVEREPVDEDYGRSAVIIDPFGHRWMLNKPPATATRLRPGDVAHITMVVNDDERAAEFYGAVLGLRFTPGSVPRAWAAEGVQPQFGLWNNESGRAEVQLCFRVTDVDAAVRRVRQHGGQAGQVDRKPYGLLVECEDDQGAHFQLWQPA